MAIVNRISEQEYRELALNDPDRLWELWDGVLVEKPLMSMKHEDVASYLGAALIAQLDRRLYRVNINGGRARLSPRSYYIPDVVVIPAAYKLPFEDDPRAFNAFAEPLPLVVEVWSPSTGALRRRDKAAGLSGARGRRDLVHPALRADDDRLAETAGRELRGRHLPGWRCPGRFPPRRRHRLRRLARRVSWHATFVSSYVSDHRILGRYAAMAWRRRPLIGVALASRLIQQCKFGGIEPAQSATVANFQPIGLARPMLAEITGYQVRE